jgi:hypothetical protein
LISHVQFLQAADFKPAPTAGSSVKPMTPMVPAAPAVFSNYNRLAERRSHSLDDDASGRAAKSGPEQDPAQRGVA